MFVHVRRRRPLSWSEESSHSSHFWLTPVVAFDWCWEWIAYFLSRWNLLVVLEYLGSFSVLVAVIFYFSESGDRVKQKHYQAWQVVNTAQGKGGNGGRIDALQELSHDGVALTGVDLSGAFLQGIHLPDAKLNRANLNSVDARDSTLYSANLAGTNLHFANFRSADLSAASLEDADLTDSDFYGANLSRCKLSGADLGSADLRYADLAGIDWKSIKGLKNANIYGAKNAPATFVTWALSRGAVQAETDESWQTLAKAPR